MFLINVCSQTRKIRRGKGNYKKKKTKMGNVSNEGEFGEEENKRKKEKGTIKNGSLGINEKMKERL